MKKPVDPSNLALCKFSRRETIVFQMLIAEYKGEEIAKALKLNEKTISTYKLRLLRKTQSKTIIGLYLFSLRPDIQSFIKQPK